MYSKVSRKSCSIKEGGADPGRKEEKYLASTHLPEPPVLIKSRHVSERILMQRFQLFFNMCIILCERLTLGFFNPLISLHLSPRGLQENGKKAK